MTSQPESNVLSSNLGGGPHGLGDPNDKTLRKVEKEVLIPKLMREMAKTHKCATEVTKFESCCKKNSLFMVFNCRKENDTLKECQAKWYENKQFINECTEIYLKKRSDYRSSGLTVKQRDRLAKQQQQQQPNVM